MADRFMFDNIVLFTRLIETGSYSKTAEDLNISASKLTRRIQELESYFNQLLLIRDTRSFELTSYGESLYNNFKDLRHQLDRFIMSMTPSTGLTRGELKIALPIVRSLNMISPYLGYFNKKHPNITLNIFYQYKLPDFKHDSIDIAVTQHNITSNRNYISEFLRSEPIQLYCTPNYAEKYGMPRNIEELSNHLIIGGIDFEDKTVNFARLTNIYTKEEKILNVSKSLKVNNPLHSLEIGLLGEHIFYSWNCDTDHLVNEGKLLAVLPEYVAYQTNLYVIYRRNLQQQELLFLDFIRRCANKTIKSDLQFDEGN